MDTTPLAKPSRSRLIAASIGVAVFLGLVWFIWGQTASIKVAENDWPWWRGSNHNNIGTGDAATEWSESKNIRWKSDVPGRGHGSPIVVGTSVYLASADDLTKTLSLYSFDRATGEPKWETPLTSGEAMHKSIKNTYASSSPACDGSSIFYPWISDQQLWLASVSVDGTLNWKKPIAPFISEHGYGSSPCLYQSLVIIPGDNLGTSYLTAVDRQTGNIVWQTQRSAGGSYTSPVIHPSAGRSQLIMSGQNSVVSYHPATGEVLWQCEGPGLSTIGTASFNDRLAFFTCGASPMIAGVMAIEMNSGKIVWQADAMANVPSSLLVDDSLLVAEDRGTLVCYDANSGQKKWKERIGGNLSASPVAVGDKVFLPQESGIVSVFEVGDSLKRIAENDLGDGGFASPVIIGGEMFLRTEHFLYCIANDPLAD
ncbi:MAG: PQQ-binding-like beta-propeller repeat protein [Rubripirellula sp.]|jgi:outer membrane protein assembly factor BamB|nr:PQQ-binding-like beta-propeller repeat protein [Rubripirellula sp.]